MAKRIGPTFGNEIFAAGLGGLPFTWGEDGVIEFHPSMSQAQIDGVRAVYAAHDPTAKLPPSAFSVALTAVLQSPNPTPGQIKAAFLALLNRLEPNA